MNVLVLGVVSLPFLVLLVLRGPLFRTYAWGLGGFLLVIWLIDWFQRFQPASVFGFVPEPVGGLFVLYETLGYVGVLVLRLLVWGVLRLRKFLINHGDS
jgi:hypothetical protein